MHHTSIQTRCSQLFANIRARKKDRKVAECIARFSNEDGKSEPSDELIATMTGLTLDEVRVSTRRLAAKGIFTIETVYD